MRTVEAITETCRRGWCDYCSGSCRGNDTDGIGHAAGSVLRILCTCSCHKKAKAAPVVIALRGTPEHERYCAGCYEVEPGVFIHPPYNGGVQV